MAEILPAVIPRRWTSDIEKPQRKSLLPHRTIMLLLLAAGLMLLSGTTVGILAWWRPLVRPIWIVLSIAREDAVTIPRGLALWGDSLALLNAAGRDKHSFSRQDGITRREFEQLMAAMRMVRSGDRLCVYLGAAADINGQGQVVLYPSDIGPAQRDAAIPLLDVLTALAKAESSHKVLLLDLRAVDGSSPGISPPTGIDVAIHKLLKQQTPADLLVITSSTVGELSHEVPGRCRTVFGWFVERGLRGDADGYLSHCPADGRIDIEEFVAYLRGEVYSFAQHACGATQTPTCYGDAGSFEVSVVTTPIDDDEQPAALAEYPKWLAKSWADYQQLRHSGQFVQNVEAFHRWTIALLTVEAAWARCAPKAILSEAQTELEDAQTHFPLYATSEPATSDSASSAAALDQAVTDVASYVASLQQHLQSSPPDQQVAISSKMQAEFLKAQAKTPGTVLAAAIFVVAQQSANRATSHLNMLVDLLNALPSAPSDEDTMLLHAVASIARSCPEEFWQPLAAQNCLRLASETRQLRTDAGNWPWIQEALNRVWNDRVHAEVLLLARGYAPLSEANVLLDSTASQSQSLVLSVSTLNTARSTRNHAMLLLPTQVYWAEADPNITDTWLAATLALRDLDSALALPDAPPRDAAALRRLADRISRLQSGLQTQIDQLERPYATSAIAQRVAECSSPNANAHDLTSATRLLASPLLSPEDRNSLTQAYHQLAQHLVSTVPEHASNVTIAPVATVINNDIATLTPRQRMAKVWQLLPPLPTVFSPEQQLQQQLACDSWCETAVRYREAQWQRVLNNVGGGVTSTPAAFLNLVGVNILGPFVCDDLTREQNRAHLEVAWHVRSDSSSSPVEVDVVSPSAALTATPQAPTLPDGESVELQLAWKPQGEVSNKTSIAGVLLVLTSQGRSYFAPISLPHLDQQSQIAISVSTSATKCTPLNEVIQLRPNGDPRSLYVYLQNATQQTRQVSLLLQGKPMGPPQSLASQELKMYPLPSFPSDAGHDDRQFTLEAVDAITQDVLGQHVGKLAVRRPIDAAEVLSTEIINDPTLGVCVKVEVQATTGPDGEPVDVALTFDRLQSGVAVRAQGGQLQGTLTNKSRHQQLSASGLNYSPGEAVRCGITIDGVTHVLVYEGHAPALGTSGVLTLLDAPNVAVEGVAFSTPVASYPLDVSATNAPRQSHINVQLVPQAPPQSALLQRVLPGRAPLTIHWQETKPPGGVAMSATGSQEKQIFDTSGLVGRYMWQATLLDEHGHTLAHTERAVVFDNSPPVAARFVRSPATAVKGTRIPFSATAWDELSNIADVKFFLGLPDNGKPPATATLIHALPSATDATVWTADLPLPKEAGNADVTAMFTNGAGLVSFATTSIEVIEAEPTPQGSIQGEVLEGNRPQPGLDVVLLHATGGEIARTKTDPQGNFVFDKLPAGAYVVQCSKVSSQRKGESKITVAVGPPTNVTIKLVMDQKKV